MKKDNATRILLSIILLALTIALVYFIARLLVTSQQPTEVKASLSPVEVTVSNLTSNSAVVSWYSGEAIEGFLKYGTEKDQFTTTVLDFRDETAPSARQLFYVRLDNLLPERQYYFQITLGTDTFSTPDTKYTFTTLPAVEEISVPNPLLITAPSDFVEGITYVHASNDTGVSTTASVYSTSENMTIDRSTMKDATTGKAFDIGTGNILVSITTTNGKRSSGVIKNTDQSITLDSLTSPGDLYVAGTIVPDTVSTPTSSPAEQPGDAQTNPIVLTSCGDICQTGKYCQCPSGCNNPTGVYLSSIDTNVCGGTAQTLPPTVTPTPTPTTTPPPTTPAATPPTVTPTPTPAPTPTQSNTLPSTDVNTDLALALNVIFGISLIILGYKLRNSSNK